MMVRKLLWTFVAGLLLTSAEMAAAQKSHHKASAGSTPPGGLVVWLEPQNLPEAQRTEVTSLIAGSIGEQAILLDREKQEAALRRQPEILRCLLDSDCHELRRNDEEVSYALLVDLRTETVLSSVNYRFSASLLDLRNADVAAKSEESCLPCNPIIISEQIGRMARRMMLETAHRPRGIVSVSSNPSGARVLIDGRWVGITPYAQSLFSGQRSLELRSDGYQPKQQTIAVLEGQPLRLKLSLRRAQQASQAAILTASAPH